MSNRDASPKRDKKTYLHEILKACKRAMFREDKFLFPAPRSKHLLDDHLMAVENLKAKRITKLYACAFLTLFWAEVRIVGGVQTRNNLEVIEFSVEDRGVFLVGENRLIHGRGNFYVDTTEGKYSDPLKLMKAFLRLIEAYRQKEFRHIIWPLDEV